MTALMLRNKRKCSIFSKNLFIENNYLGELCTLETFFFLQNNFHRMTVCYSVSDENQMFHVLITQLFP